jgi:alpha-tubulin suppressor-like RCC1 family protein
MTVLVVLLVSAAGAATSVLAGGTGKGGGEAGASLQSWGAGTSGQIGDGTIEGKSTPVAVKGVTCALDTAVSDEDSFAVLGDGKLAAWGSDATVDAGGLGDELHHFEHSAEPIEVPGISEARQVAADIPDAYVVLANGTVEGWGDGHDGELGRGSDLSSYDAPVAVGGFKEGEVKAMATGDATELALLSDGQVDSWGFDEDLQLGNGKSTPESTATPARVEDEAGTGPLTGIKQVAEGTDFSLALTETGEVLAWGGNSAIGLGAGSKVQSDLPVNVEDVAGDKNPLTGVKAIAAGGNFALALLENGTVVGWGNDIQGQLGNGKEELGPLLHPVVVEGLEHITAIAAGELDGYALDESGKVYSWGANQLGELGAGASPEKRDKAELVSGLGSGNSALATGSPDSQHELALGPISTECVSGAGTTGKTNTETKSTESTSSNPSAGGTTPTPSTPARTSPAAAAEAATKLALECSDRKLALTDVVEKNGRVFLDGAAVASLTGQTVKIVFDGHQQVATAEIGPQGQFSATAPLPPPKLRDSNSARYLAESGGLQSLNLKLTRRLILDQPTSSAGKVTLTGQVIPPLGKPVQAIAVEQQLTCASTSTVARVKPSASGHFDIEVHAPAGALAALYRLSTKVRESTSSKALFSTDSLPETVGLEG